MFENVLLPSTKKILKKLREMFTFYHKKYGNLADKEIMIKKALIYFRDADKEEMPVMLTQIKWNEVKDWFVKETKKINI